MLHSEMRQAMLNERGKEVVQAIAVYSVRNEMMIYEVVRQVLIVGDMRVLSICECCRLDRNVLHSYKIVSLIQLSMQQQRLLSPLIPH